MGRHHRVGQSQSSGGGVGLVLKPLGAVVSSVAFGCGDVFVARSFGRL